MNTDRNCAFAAAAILCLFLLPSNLWCVEIKSELDKMELLPSGQGSQLPVAPKTDPKVVALCDACNKGNLAEVKRLIESGVKPNVSHWSYTPLSWAAFRGHYPIVVYLIDHGADPNYWADGYRPPLTEAVRGRGGPTLLGQGHPEYTLGVADFLIKNGANPNLADGSGETPLMYAVMANDLEMALLLLKNGAEINARSKAGRTALYFARKKANLEMVRALLDLGAE